MGFSLLRGRGGVRLAKLGEALQASVVSVPEQPSKNYADKQE